MDPYANKLKNVQEGEEPFPSLSDFHDYEPNLEFDDTELHQSPDAVAHSVDLIQELDSNELGSPVSDFTDENFEEELAEVAEENMDSLAFGSSSYPPVDDPSSDIAQYGIVDVKGDDAHGRKIIVIYACKLPPVHKMDHQKFLEYLKYTLGKYVEQDYSLVYFHYGLNSKNKPSLKWLLNAYSAFDRNYKKNLKSLYLVHPTWFLKLVLQVFKPLVSAKFGKKINYISNLKQLDEHIPLSQLAIPSEVKEFDKKQGGAVTGANENSSQAVLPTQQFGVTLSSIIEHYNVKYPPIVTQCIEYLESPDALEVEGLFRRSPNVAKLKILKDTANQGLPVTFDDPHSAAVLLKTFLRELKEPLLTFDLYDKIVKFQSWSKEDVMNQVSKMLLEEIPPDNYELLKYLIRFLSKVMERADLNKMTAPNLAIVFGPNLIWSESVPLSLRDIGPINMFTQYLLQHHNNLFVM